MKVKKIILIVCILLVFIFIKVGCNEKDTSKDKPALTPTIKTNIVTPALSPPAVTSPSPTIVMDSNVTDSDSITLAPEKALVENVDDDLCGENEEILLNFQMVDLDKYMSVCMPKDQQEYIIYRFGTKEDIELEYSDKTESSWDKFTYSYYLRGGGKENEGLDLNYLYFENGGYKYQIYEEYSANNDDTSVGILVTNLETGVETDLKGVSESIKGSLIELRGNEKINLYSE